MKIHVELKGASPDQLDRAIAAARNPFAARNIAPGDACLAADELQAWDFRGSYRGKTPLKEAYALGAVWSDAREIAVLTLAASTGLDPKQVNLDTQMYLSED